MKSDGSRYLVYCSLGASRIIKFFSHEQNLKNFKPVVVVYDGVQENAITNLKKIFGNDLLLFDHNQLTEGERKKIHTTTTNFLQSVMLQHNIEYLISFGDKILKSNLIQRYPRKLINFHPSLLPAFGGLRDSIDQAIKYGAQFLGNTAHFIDEGVDTGEIVVQSAMLTEEFEKYEDVLELQFPMIKMILRDIMKFDIPESEIFSELSGRTKSFMIPKHCNSF